MFVTDLGRFVLTRGSGRERTSAVSSTAKGNLTGIAYAEI
jgi:hypothetical protein